MCVCWVGGWGGGGGGEGRGVKRVGSMQCRFRNCNFVLNITNSVVLLWDFHDLSSKVIKEPFSIDCQL